MLGWVPGERAITDDKRLSKAQPAAADAGSAPPGEPNESGRGAEPTGGQDPGLRSVDYAGISPLTLPAEALLRAIKGLSKLFWISIVGTVLTMFLGSLANLGGAVESVSIGEYSIPISVLPIGCLAFAMFMFWLTAARLRMLDVALGDGDLTANLAREIFRLDPPVLDVFDAGNVRPFALLSGFSMLLWNWSLFFGASVGLIFSATIIRGAAASVDQLPVFGVYYPDQGVCMVLDEGAPVPSRLEDFFTENNLQARMVAAGFAFTEGVGVEYMGTLQDKAQRQRRGAWQGAFEPPGIWAARRDGP